MTTPGPALVYKCPSCGNLAQKGSINSGNTFGAVFYSDGRLDAPMLPEFPAITKCKKCSGFYWLEDENKVGEYEPYERWGGPSEENEAAKKQWQDADRTRFLNPDELQEAINARAHRDDPKKEKYLRKRLWWQLNDPARRKDAAKVLPNITVQYAENCHGLLMLFIPRGVVPSDDDRMFVAELCRNMELYDECAAVLGTVKDPDYEPVIGILKTQCEKRNRHVVVLQDDSRGR